MSDCGVIPECREILSLPHGNGSIAGGLLELVDIPKIVSTIDIHAYGPICRSCRFSMSRLLLVFSVRSRGNR